MDKVITISGWGQKNRVFDDIFDSYDSINYQDHDDISNLFEQTPIQNCDILLGWSLGGQIALRLVTKGIMSPRLLVLLATPFQFLASDKIKCGMKEVFYQDLCMDFESNQQEFLKNFAYGIAKNDSNTKKILPILKESYSNSDNLGYWLNQLGRFSCYELNLSNLPRTLIIHGNGDAVIDSTQAGLFIPFIKECKMEVFDKCGHAPHLHDPNHLKEIISREYEK